MPAQQPPNSYGRAFLAETVLASAARTTSSNSVLGASYGTVKSIRAALVVTAASGTTPTLDVTIEDSLDGTNWFTIGTFTQKTATATQVIDITTPFGERVRVKWVVGGTTPSFTFKVDFATDADPS